MTTVVTFFKAYILELKFLRGLVTKLFLTLTPPHTRVIQDTQTRWVQSIMTTAEIDTSVFRPPLCVRPVPQQKGGRASVTEIMNSVGWSRNSAFTRFYDKLVVNNMFDVAVLQNKIST